MMTIQPVANNKQDSLTIVMGKVRAKIKARVPFIWLVSDEEQRVQVALSEQTLFPLKREIFFWSGNKGIRAINGTEVSPAKQLNQTLDFIIQHRTEEGRNGSVFILQDPHVFITPAIARQLRDMYVPLLQGQTQDKSKATTLIFLSGRVCHILNGVVEGLEPSLVNLFDVIDIPLPTKQDIMYQLQTALTEWDKNNKEQEQQGKRQKKSPLIKLTYSDSEVDTFASALQGLTMVEILRAVPESFHLHNQIDVDTLLDLKKHVVKRSGLLEVVDNLPTLENIGGLDIVKQFVDIYAGQFSEEAVKFGVEPLKGVLLTGIPGCGKSLCAKALARLWKINCLRMDVGKLMQGIVGASEANVRQVIKVAEAASPCLLWIDEVEKQTAGVASSNQSDSGTTARVFQTLLTAMEEGLKGVCIAATANDITAIPPEFIRRFDEVFFVDLPVLQERKDIFGIHLSKRKRDPQKFDLDHLAKKAVAYTGSEIEKAVKLGIAIAYRQKTELNNEILLQALGSVRPISIVMANKIEECRKWAVGKARRASSLTEEEEKQVPDLDTLSPAESLPHVVDPFGDNNYRR